MLYEVETDGLCTTSACAGGHPCPGRDSVHRHNHFQIENYLPSSNLPSKERSSYNERFGDAVTARICLGMALGLFQGQILANNVAVDETEVDAKNGRIYTLSGVLIPPSIVPILPHRCNETKRELKLVKELRKFGKWEGAVGA